MELVGEKSFSPWKWQSQQMSGAQGTAQAPPRAYGKILTETLP